MDRTHPFRVYSECERERVWKTYLARPNDERVWHQVALANMGLVLRMINSRFGNLDRETRIDLLSYGYIALYKAICTFDLERDTEFSSIAVPKIFGGITNYLRKNLYTIRIPAERLAAIRRIEKVERHLLNELGRPPTDDETAVIMGVPSSTVKYLRYLLGLVRVLSLDEPIDPSNPESFTLGEVLHGTPEWSLTLLSFDEEEATVETLGRALDILSERDKAILILRAQGMELKEIARRYNLTWDAIKKVIRQSVKRIRVHMSINPDLPINFSTPMGRTQKPKPI